MKRFSTLYTFLLVCLAIQAQEVKLTIENTAGGLKNAMTTEEIKTVTNLTLTGSMDDSDFYLIRDGMPKLKKLNIKEVEVDTIPIRAFCQQETIETIYLPRNVKYLADNSFQEFHQTIIITGQFPQLGMNVFSGAFDIALSDDNKYCKTFEGNIYSEDGKILFLFLTVEPLLITIPEGTETIASRAFDNAWICGLKFPASLKKIEAHAFTNARQNGYTRVFYEDETLYCFYFKSVLPPILEGDVFNDAYWYSSYFIRVPIGSKQYYKDANEQWSVFDRIEEYGFDPESITSTEKQPLKTVKEGNTLFLSSESNMSQINVISPQGSILYSTVSNETTESIPLQPGINIVKVTFGDKNSEVIKILN